MSRASAEKQAKLNYIFDSVRQLFAEQGLENCSMEDIAAAAQYTRRTLYTYFKSRDELYLLIHMADLAHRWARQQEALAGAEGGLNRIRIWADVFIAHSRENPQALRMENYWDFYGVEPERLSPAVFKEFKTLNDELATALRVLFRGGMADGSLRADLDVNTAISQFLYSLRAVTGRAFSASYTFGAFDADRYLEHFFVTLERGIGGSGGSS